MLTTRTLPAPEWPRLNQTVAADLWPLYHPSTATVTVVESDGELVGCVSHLPMWHVEALWIAEQERRHGHVIRRLLHAVVPAIRAAGSQGAMTAALDPAMDEILTRLGARLLPGKSYAWRFPEDLCRLS